jgi:hypothetical protein
MASANTPCPCCGSFATDCVEHFSAKDAASWFCPADRDDDRWQRLATAIEKLWKAPDCQMLTCAECSFLFASPHVAGDEAFYSILHEESGYPAFRWEYGVTLDLLNRIGPAGNLLDIGAGVGDFLRLVPPQWNRYAIESTQKNTAILAASGITACGSLEDYAAVVNGPTNVVTMFQVLEHIADPAPLLAKVRDLLPRDGMFVISTPNSVSQAVKLPVVPQFDAPPNHVSIYSPQALQATLERADFNVIELRNEPPGIGSMKRALAFRMRWKARQNHSSIARWASMTRNQRLRHGLLALAACIDIPYIALNGRIAAMSNNMICFAQ